MIINSISPDQSKYLQELRSIVEPLKSLYFSGNLPQNRVKTVSIIGARKPSSYGQEFAYKFAYELAKQGIVIVSGLAVGIDTIAHKAALDAGGTTIAILPGGLDKIYPSSNTNLAKQIIQNGGCLISQFEPGQHPYKSSFVQRSKIVSGIADGVLVIEAAAKSGTIHTAGFAKKQDKSLMALPGNINSLTSEGCNNLIKQGATTVTEVQDILNAIGFNKKLHQSSFLVAQNTTEELILAAIKNGHKTTDQIIKNTKISAAEVAQALTMLEIAGQVKQLDGQWTA